MRFITASHWQNWRERNRAQGLAQKELSKTKCESRIPGTPGRTEKELRGQGQDSGFRWRKGIRRDFWYTS